MENLAKHRIQYHIKCLSLEEQKKTDFKFMAPEITSSEFLEEIISSISKRLHIIVYTTGVTSTVRLYCEFWLSDEIIRENLR